MSKQKKQSFLGGAAILTAAVVIVKLIGAVYKLPLNNILGSVGKTYFDTAYLIYNFLMIFSTAGLPLAQECQAIQAACGRRLLSGLSEKEKQQFALLLETVLDNGSQLAEEDSI